MTKYSTLANELYPYLLQRFQRVSGRNGNGGGSSSAPTTLSQLTDVQLTALADGDFLSYEASIGKWVNVDAPVGGGGGSYTAGWGIDISGGSVISVDVAEIIDLNAGLEVVSNKIAVNLQTSSGLVVNSSGLAIDSNIAGNGLAITAGKIMSVEPKSSGGLDVDATGVFVKKPTNSGLHLDSTGLWFHRRGDTGLTSGLSMTATDGVYLADAMAGDGLLWSTPTTNRVLVVDEDFNFAWTGTHTFADAVTLNANGTFNTGVFTFNTAPQIAANLHFLGSARSITSAATLTLSPTGNLHLDPTGNISMPNAQSYRSTIINDLPTGIDGMNIFNRSDFSPDYVQLTIGAIKADELHVRIFTADETRINRGEEYWSKSFGIVQEDFDIPGVGVNVDVWFEDAPGAGVGFSLFAANDWLLLRTINWGTGLVVQKIWFQVVGAKLAQETLAVHGVDRQQWRIKRIAGGWTTTSAANKVKAGNVMLDAGQVGQGWVHLSALASDGGPFIQFGKMTSISTTPLHSNYVRIGNLKNAVGYSVDTWGMAAGNNLGLDRNLGEFSGFVIEGEQGLSLYNTDLTIYNSAVKTVSLNRAQGLVLKHDVDTLGNLDRQINWYDDIDATTSVPRTAIGSYVYDNSGMPTRQMEIFVTGVSSTASAQIVAVRAMDPNASRDASLILRTRETLSTGAIGGIAELFANEVQIQQKLLVGGELDETDSIAKLHVVESTTAVNQTAGFVVEQKSTGDAVMHWRLTTPNRYYSMGIDNSDGDKFKISASASLGTSDFFVYDPATGLVTVSGLTGGGGGGGGTYTAGSGITIVGTEIAVDSTVVRTTYVLTAGDGLIGAGDFSANRTISVGAGAGIAVSPDSVSVNLVANSGLSTTGGLGVASTLAGDGLTLTSGVLDVVAHATGGLLVNANSVQVKLPTISGLHSDSTGLWIHRRGDSGASSGISMNAIDGIYLDDDLPGDGLVWDVTDRILHLDLGSGLEFSSALVRIKLPANSGLVRDATGLYVDSAIAGDGLVMTSGVIDVVPLSTGGLAVSANSLQVKLRVTGSGLKTDVNGLWIHRRDDAGLASGLSMTVLDGLYLADAVAGDGLLWTNATDRVLQVRTGHGLELSGTTPNMSVRIMLPTNSGLTRDATGLYVADTLAGDGLSMSAAKVMSVNVSNGLEIALDSVRVKSTIAGDGLIFTSGVIDVVAANASITVGANSLNVNLAHAWTWTGTHTHAALSTFNSGATFNTGVFTFNTDPQVNANLDFLGARSITSNSTNALTIAAGGNLILASAGDLARSVSHSDLVTGISGFRMWDRGANYIQLTIGAMKMDELYARVFVADEVRIDRGEEYWSKSFGIVEEDFVLPADEATVNVWFENSPGLASANLFSVGDWLLLRAIDWGVGLAIYKVWFTVTALVTAGSVDGYRQRWTIKRETGGTTGLTIKKGGVMLDAGQVGQGWIHLSALAQDGGPFIQIGDFTSIVSSDTPTFTNRVRMGNLSGAAGISGTFWGFAAGNDLSLDASLGSFSGFTVGKGIGSPGTSYDGLRIYNVDMLLYEGGEKIISLTNDGGLRMQLPDNTDATVARRITWLADVDSVFDFTDRPVGISMKGIYYPGVDNTAFEIDVTAPTTEDAHYRIITERTGNATYSTNFNMRSGGTRPSIAMGVNDAGSVLNGSFNFSENNALLDGGINLEQQGSGDALVKLSAGGQLWLLGIDNSVAGDPLRISPLADLANQVFSLTTAGVLQVTGSVGSPIIRAISSAGLRGEDDGGNLGWFIEDGGFVGINTTNPTNRLYVEETDADINPATFAYTSTATDQPRGNVFLNRDQSANSAGGLRFNFTDNGGTTRSGAGVLVGKEQLYSSADSATWDAYLALMVAQNGTLVERMRITSAGHVGIGTTTPGIDVVGTYDMTAAKILQIDSTTPSLVVRGSTSAAVDLMDTGATSNNKWMRLLGDAGFTKFRAMSDAGAVQTDNILVMNHSTGAVGFGEAAPVASVDILQLATEGLRLTSAGTPQIVARRHSGAIGSPSQVTNGVDLLTLGVQGYTSSGWPAVSDYSAEIQFEASESHTSSARGTLIRFYTTPNGSSGPTSRLTIDQDGSIVAPEAYNTTVATVPNMSIASGGKITRTTHVNSSLRYKEDIQEIAPDSYADLFDSLRPVSYKLKPDYGGNVPGARRKVGLIAEEVEAAGGGAFIQYDSEGRPDVLMYDRLIVVLIAELRGLKKRVMNMEGEL